LELASQHTKVTGPQAEGSAAPSSTNGRAQAKHSGPPRPVITPAEAAAAGAAELADWRGVPTQLCNGVASDAPPREGAWRLRGVRQRRFPSCCATPVSATQAGRRMPCLAPGGVQSFDRRGGGGRLRTLLRLGSRFLAGACGNVTAFTALLPSSVCFAAMACRKRAFRPLAWLRCTLYGVCSNGAGYCL
jgi:hypothetical protein